MVANSNRLFSFFFRTIFIKLAVFVLNTTGLVRKKFFPFLSMIMISYRKSRAQVSSNIGKICAGQRLPYDKKVYEQTLGKGFVILNHGMKLENTPCEVLIIKDYMKLRQKYFVILRPDKHIAYIGDDTNVIKKYFSKL